MSPAVKTAPHKWRCGFCSSGQHFSCRRTYRGAGYQGTDVTCACECDHRLAAVPATDEVEPSAVLATGETPPPLPSLLLDGGPACPTCGRAWFSADPGPAYRDLVRPEPAADVPPWQREMVAEILDAAERGDQFILTQPPQW